MVVKVGDTEGTDIVGDHVGEIVGFGVGNEDDGRIVGGKVGIYEGILVGLIDGNFVGTVDGDGETNDGATEGGEDSGLIVGTELGN